MSELVTDRIGIELEVEDLLQNKIPINDRFFITHDASCEKSTIQYKKKLTQYMVEYKSPILNGRRDTLLVGGEIVSKNDLYYSNENTAFELFLENQLGMLVEAGERPVSYRGSIHIHVNFPLFESHSGVKSLKIMKRVVTVGEHLEEMFFHIGGMGYKYRGVVINNSAYCRPITGKGPQVVLAETANGLWPVQVFRTEDLLEADSIQEFYRRLGNTPVEPGNVERYHPARYTWLNLYSTMLRRTLEFRVFNKVLNKYLIISIIKLCQEVTNAILSESLDTTKLETNSIYDSVDNKKSHLILDNFISNIGKPKYLRDREINILHMLIENSELTGSDFGNKYVYTHLRRFDRSSGRYLYSASSERYCPPVLENVEILDSTFVDVHNMYARQPSVRRS